MIVFLHGQIYGIGPGYVDMNVQGVGYRVWTTDPVIGALSVGEDAFLYTYHHVREDGQQLFGFLEESDRLWFEQLISVSGIGPKSALQMVSSCGYDAFAEALWQEDVGFLSTLPGVGKKTAQRLIVELKDKMSMPLAGKVATSGPRPLATGLRATGNTLAGVQGDVIEALKTLGYNERQASEIVLSAIPVDSQLSIEDALRVCLQQMDRPMARTVGR